MSDHEPNDFDLSIFKEDDHMEQCDQHSNDPIEGCKAVSRLIRTLKYYTLLDIIKSKDKRDIFSAFMSEVYLRFLDDFEHLVKKHNNLEEINKILRRNKVFDECDVTKCSFTSRHHSAAHESNNIDISMDAVLRFYVKTMDSLHFYVFHLFDCGLRMEKMNDNDNDNKYDEYDMNNNKYFDRQFARVSRIINERKHLTLSFNRFKNNSKFHIAMETHNKERESSTTFFDNLFLCLLLENNIKEISINTFKEFIGSNKYDSDAVKADINDETKGNIASNIDDKQLVKVVTEFINATAIHSSSFNIGLTLYYWPHYEKMNEFDENRGKRNINDHGGYKIRDLFVQQRYPHFKEEMMNYPDLSMKQYESLRTKVFQFLQTDTVKNLKAKTKDTSWTSTSYITLKYGIKNGEAILSRHLFALFLYTDFSALCTHFSATFRPNKHFESLSSIKERNSEYWWMSRCLRELVELYGESKRWERDDDTEELVAVGLLGPWYSGLGAVLPFPEFEVRFCGPTSTSTQFAIATIFAGSDGVVVQLNNNFRGYHQYLPGFCCSSLSNFAEEAEVIFMGGHYRIKIESVRILNGADGKCQNFEIFFGAFAKFNKMFNGSAARTGAITQDEKAIITKLFDWSFGLCDLKDIFDQYVLDSFQSFTQNKKHIVFNYCVLSQYNDKELRDLLFYGMKCDDEFEPSKEEKTNIFRKEIFKLFENIKNIDIYTTSDTGKDPSALSFEALLSEIKKERFNQITIKGVHKQDTKKESWIYSLWQVSSQELTQKYQQNGYKISFKNSKNEMYHNEDCVVIEKM